MTDEPFILGANLRDTRPQITAGISRNMQCGVDARGLSVTPLAAGPNQGGGDLNGTAATSILAGKSGTNATRWQTIRTPRSGAGNYCGVV